MNDFVQIAGYRVATAFPELPADEGSAPLVINTINTHAWVVATHDNLFREALVSSSVLLPDGEGIVWAVRRLTGRKIRKIAGFDLHQYMLEYLNRVHGTCFYLGATGNTLMMIREKLEKEYPAIRAGFFSPPFKPVFTEADDRRMIGAVNDNDMVRESGRPLDVLFVGMTAPKQEKWVFQHKDELRAGIICSIGAVFDFYAGTAKRPPDWMIRHRLEWLGRLITHPGKIWRRVLISGPRFLVSIRHVHDAAANNPSTSKEHGSNLDLH